MGEYAELLKRLEAATGSDRALDDDLMWWADYGWADTWGCWADRRVGNRGGEPTTITDVQGLPFTASIDAALSLVERVLPAGPWLRWFAAGGEEQDGDNYSFDLRYDSNPDNLATASAKTMPLAILIALLKAKESSHVA